MTLTRLARAVQTHKAIAHPVRLRMLLMLRESPLCGCQIGAVVKLAASTISEHLSELKKAGLVVEKKEGRWVEYSLVDDTATETLLAAISPGFERDATVRADAILVKALKRVPLEELCSVDLDLTQLERPAVATALERAERLLTER
ncbi:MAG: winged helix-turn-helix transcriptional regulator [Acidobacteria bacterium]|nr:winged helix-turn-helix transcriptional regulator [Acidobacteriota bacterium]